MDLWESPEDVANWPDLIPSVQDNHTAQDNPPFFPFSRDEDAATLGFLTQRPHVIHHGLDAERTPHYNQIVDTQSHNYKSIYFYYDKNTNKLSVKNDNKRRYSAKLTCELQLCATASTTTSDVLNPLVFESGT